MKIQKKENPKFQSTIQALIARKEKFISLGLGEPELETSQKIKDAAYEALNQGYTKYSSPLGLPELRDKISEKLKAERGIKSKKENVLITPGGKNALFISIIGMIEDEDEIINFTPCYVSNLPMLHLASRKIKVKNIKLSSPEFKIDREELEKNINKKTKIIIINYPNNPTGAILNKNDAEYLSDLVEKNNLFVISDEVYSKYVFEGENISIGSIEKIKDRVLTVDSFSKSHFMTGWRIGYINTSEAIINELSKINLHVNTNTAAFIQKAAIKALELREDELDNYKNIIKHRRDVYSSIIKDVYPHFKLNNGGLFTFLNIESTGLKSDEFAAKLLEKEKVAVVPGINFGEDFDNYCRISFSCKPEDFEKGVLGIKNFIETA